MTCSCTRAADYKNHLRAGEEPCQASRTAQADWMRDYRTRMYLAGGPLTVDSTGTARRLRALAAMGWSFAAIADQLGVTPSSVQQWTTNRRVYRHTAARVADLFEQLSMRPGPSSKSRARAATAGWEPPLAWDDDTIDDPAAVPHVQAPDGIDEVAVHRAMTSRPVQLTRADRIEVTRRLTAAGRSAFDIAAVLGVTTRTVDRDRASA